MSTLNKNRLINRFLRYIKVLSPSGQEAEIAKLLKKELRALRLKPYEDSMGNIFVDLKGDDSSAPCILLNAHMDTVAVNKKIRPRRHHGFITSDGTTILGADNKAGVAIIMEVLELIKKEKIKHGDLQVVFTVQEETGLTGSKNMRQSWLKADLGYVLDGGDIEDIIYRAPSQYNVNAEVLGKAAHAGVRPEEGINAIKVASQAIGCMKLGRIDRETTSNIGVISGGEATNIVPEKVKLEGEARSHNLRKLKAQLKHIQTCMTRACRKNKATLKIRFRHVYSAFNIKPKEKVMKLAERSLKDIGIKPNLRQTGGGSDANIFNSMGIPCVILGTGMDRVHTRAERLKIEDMFESVKFVLEIIKNAGKDLKK